MITNRIIINVITFLLVSALLIVMLVVNLFRVEPRYAVTATFVDTGGVFTGQEVTYRGVTVGRVGELKVVEQGVDIELVIRRAFDRIPQDTTARVMFKSAVGEQFVDLLPATDRPPFLDDGDRISIERTQLPVQQEDLLRILDAVLAGVPPEDLENLVDTLGTGLGGRGEELRLALASLDPISAVLARRSGELNSLNRSGDRAGTAFGATSEEFVAGIASLAAVSESLARSSPSVERLLREGAQDLPVIAGLVAARKAEIDRTIANLAVITNISFANLQSLRDTLDWLPIFLFSIIQAFDGEHFRFAQLLDQPDNLPCRYASDEFPTGVPHRAPTEHGDAPYHPILNFRCLAGTGTASASAPPGPAGTAPEAPSPDTEPGGLPVPPTKGTWLDLLTGTLLGV